MIGGRRLLAAVSIASALFLAGPQHVSFAQGPGGPEPVKLRIEVTDLGFGGQPGDFTVEVEQGRLVEMTFVWAHVGWVEEEHVMVLEMGKQKLEWDEINSAHKEATLQFIAGEAGTFDFKCDLDCEIHDQLQSGHLKVRRGGAAAAAFTPTVLSVTPSTWATPGDPVTLTVALKDVKGNPVPKAEARFSVKAAFGGKEGEMAIGTVKTDANGVAFMDYRPTLAMRAHTITARFDGLGVYAESQETIVVQQVMDPPPAYTVAPRGLEGVRLWGQRGLALGALGIWGTFAFVLFQAIGIAWVRRQRQGGKSHELTRRASGS